MAAGSDSPFFLKNERLIDVDPILQGDFVYHCHDPLQFAYKIMIGSHGNFQGIPDNCRRRGRRRQCKFLQI